MIFTTSSGSTYEVDLSRKRMRRLNGNPNADHKVSSEEWKTFKMVSKLEVGSSAVFHWDITQLNKDLCKFSFTQTSAITDIQDIVVTPNKAS